MKGRRRMSQNLRAIWKQILSSEFEDEVVSRYPPGAAQPSAAL